LEFPQEDRNQVRRIPKRAHYDADTIYAILDAGSLCHVAFTVDSQPFIIPTLYGRDGDVVYLHGSAASRMLQNLAEGIPICIAVTHVDGLVLARSAFHHSMNYRSAVLFGAATEVTGEEKDHGLFVISEHIVPGRWAEARPPAEQELKATSVLKLSIETASAKIRTGPPIDDDADYELPIWAGVVPVTLQYGMPLDDGRLAAGTRPSAALRELLTKSSPTE